MRYFHRTSREIDDVLAEADRYFGVRFSPVTSDGHQRTFSGPTGRVTITARAEGGHYTLITVTTDQVGESEIDKVAKRFLSVVHAGTHPAHEVRGAY